MNDKMPKGGVKELIKSESGRRYLAKLQKKHAKDLLQPGQPGFKETWGNQVKATERMHKKQRDIASEEWERKEFDNKKRNNINSKKYY